MNYKLNTKEDSQKKPLIASVARLLALMLGEKRALIGALIAVTATSLLNLAAPRLVAHTIDTYVVVKDYHGVLVFGGIILVLYLLALVTSYLQTRLMGAVGQRVLYRLRNQIFEKLQSLPAAFFSQNKTGDLISRINNDTEKINQFFSQSLMQFFGNFFLILGSAIFLLSINLKLGAAALAPALVLLVITRSLSPWIKRKNFKSAQSTGAMSAEVQESLNNFKVIIAFNRRDFFKKRFKEVNDENYLAAVQAGVANITFTPIYGLASNLGQLIVLAYGISLIMAGQFTIGLLISFLSYANSFYNPLRQIAAIWASFQTALASWDRVQEILLLESNLPILETGVAESEKAILELRNVDFSYPDGKKVLRNINLSLETGKTYAFVGPTGGGKTTTASLMMRLYDPTAGLVLLKGRDIRTFDDKERATKIGFILQDPVLFSGTVRENIMYGNDKYVDYDREKLQQLLHASGFDKVLERFDQGIDTYLDIDSDSVSLGQKQLIAFMRAVLREPELLILDEATANIDTVTEELLEEILRQLPKKTTKVIIAHRLNTIENADEIFFVNSGEIVLAGSMQHAVDMLLNGNRTS